MFSFQYTFFNHSNLFLSLLALLHFIRPMVSLTEYFGGMIIIVWIWSTWIFCSTISTPGMSFSTFGHICVRYSFTPGFRIRLRYFGIHTTWYSVRYTECPDSLFSMIHKFIPKYLRAGIHPRACPWNSAARIEVSVVRTVMEMVPMPEPHVRLQRVALRSSSGSKYLPGIRQPESENKNSHVISFFMVPQTTKLTFFFISHAAFLSL
jgi:hypothetical protein